MGVSPLISPRSRTQLSATITYQDSIHSCKASEASFLDRSTAKSWGIPAISLPSPVTVCGLSGQPVATITHTTPCVSLVVSGNHRESVVLFLIESPNASLVLEHPWLDQHNPQVDWSRSQILSWSQSCHACCLGVASSPVSVSPVLQVEAADLAFVVLEHMAFCFDSSPCAPLSSRSCSAHLVILFANSPFPPALYSILIISSFLNALVSAVFFLSVRKHLFCSSDYLSAVVLADFVLLYFSSPVGLAFWRSGFSLLRRRMALCVHVLITVGWMTLLLRTGTSCL